jgi:hypothetical protein
MRELQAMRAAQREQIATGLLAGLGREPSEADRVAARTIASMQVEAERLETLGKSALEQRRIVVQLLRQSGFRPAPAEPLKPVPQQSTAEKIAAIGVARKAAEGVT